MLSVFSFMFLFLLFLVLLYFFSIKIKNKILKNQKNTKIVCVVYIGACVPWMAFETKFLNFVSLVA